MIRIAAVGDVHAGLDTAGQLRPHLESLPDEADVFLIAGDLTKTGAPDEAAVLAGELDGLELPIVAVLGNHDHQSDRGEEVCEVLADIGVHVLEGESVTLQVGAARVGIVGAKGFGGGFEGACATEFGEPEMKAFIRHTQGVAASLGWELERLQSEIRVVLLHYAPIRETLLGEHPEIYPFLGSYLLGEACDRHGANLILHGHAHHGTEKGLTPGGIGVRNVAQSVLRKPYAVYAFEDPEGDAFRPPQAEAARTSRDAEFGRHGNGSARAAAPR
jgi:Icc-related predicted phosphoesterase